MNERIEGRLARNRRGVYTGWLLVAEDTILVSAGDDDTFFQWQLLAYYYWLCLYHASISISTANTICNTHIIYNERWSCCDHCHQLLVLSIASSIYSCLASSSWKKGII